MIEAFEEEMNKFLKEIQKNPVKQVKEINKTFQDLKMKTEAINTHTSMDTHTHTQKLSEP